MYNESMVRDLFDGNPPPKQPVKAQELTEEKRDEAIAFFLTSTPYSADDPLMFPKAYVGTGSNEEIASVLNKRHQKIAVACLLHGNMPIII